MNDFTDIVSKVMEVSPDEGDYTGEDGLLYCGKCHTPKEAYFEDGHAALFGRDRHPTNCACQQKRIDEKRLADQQRRHEDTVKELKKGCFDTPKLQDWCFAQDNGANPQMKHARFYADNFDTFEQLGIDRLYVDEAHAYKNLFLYTKMRNVAGLSTSNAQKSSDMLLKCRYIDEVTGGKGVVFATGTPVNNSMTELFITLIKVQSARLQITF